MAEYEVQLLPWCKMKKRGLGHGLQYSATKSIMIPANNKTIFMVPEGWSESGSSLDSMKDRKLSWRIKITYLGFSSDYFLSNHDNSIHSNRLILKFGNEDCKTLNANQIQKLQAAFIQGLQEKHAYAKKAKNGKKNNHTRYQTIPLL